MLGDCPRHRALTAQSRGGAAPPGIGGPAPTGEARQRAGLQPLRVSAKEGLALINGTQVSTGLAIDGLLATERLFEAAVIAGAMTLDAARGSDGPFDPRIHAVRG